MSFFYFLDWCMHNRSEISHLFIKPLFCTFSHDQQFWFDFFFLLFTLSGVHHTGPTTVSNLCCKFDVGVTVGERKGTANPVFNNSCCV